MPTIWVSYLFFMVADAVSHIILGDLSCVKNKHEYNFVVRDAERRLYDGVLYSLVS